MSFGLVLLLGGICMLLWGDRILRGSPLLTGLREHTHEPLPQWAISTQLWIGWLGTVSGGILIILSNGQKIAGIVAKHHP